MNVSTNELINYRVLQRNLGIQTWPEEPESWVTQPMQVSCHVQWRSRITRSCHILLWLMNHWPHWSSAETSEKRSSMKTLELSFPF